jgi:hypothetical protein
LIPLPQELRKFIYSRNEAKIVKIWINPCGESEQLVVKLKFSKKWVSVAKLKARSEALRQNI